MARIAGVDIPRNKKIKVSLCYIYGLGPRLCNEILTKAGVDPDVKVSDLTEEEISRIRELIDKGYRVEGEKRREVSLNIKRLIDIGSYRGMRHRRNLPSRGQRTQTNARARRGPRRTVAGRGQRRGMAKK